MRLLLDKIQYENKPSSAIARSLTTSLCKSEVDVTSKQFAIYVGNKGQTWCPSIWENHRKKENWKYQELIALDFDNSGEDLIIPEDAIALSKQLGFNPFCCYHTFSSTVQKPKFRLVFMVMEPFLNYDEAKTVSRNLVNMFNTDAIDKGASSDPVRLFWGGKSLIWYEYSFLHIDTLKTVSPSVPSPLTMKMKGDFMEVFQTLSVVEMREVISVIKAVKDAIADPFNVKKTTNKLKKNSYYQTLGACVRFLMVKIPIELDFETIKDIIVPVIDENPEIWYNVGDDWEEKFHSHYTWSKENLR